VKKHKHGAYIWVTAPESYPGKRHLGRYVYEHHLVWWRQHGKLPADGEVIHHINGDHTDNRIENLTVLTHAEHGRLHNKVKPLVSFRCGTCGRTRGLRANVYRFRKRQSVSGRLYCSRACVVAAQWK
jgi:hypothetical protein